MRFMAFSGLLRGYNQKNSRWIDNFDTSKGINLTIFPVIFKFRQVNLKIYITNSFNDSRWYPFNESRGSRAN